MHLLVTGGCGYIGSQFVRTALNAGHSIDVIDNLSNGHLESLPKDANIHFIESDIQSDLWVSKISQKPSAAFHFAGSIEVGESVKNPEKYRINNVDNATRWLELSQSLGVEKFIYSSTAAVYGNPTEETLNEESPLNPTNPYGETKLQFEKILEQKAANDKLSFVVLRYFNAAGASPDGQFGEYHEPESHLLPRVISAALKKLKIIVNGDTFATPDGTCVRDFVHTEDLAKAHLLALTFLDKNKKGTFNLGTKRGSSVKEVIAEVEKQLATKLQVEIGPKRVGDPARLVADYSRAEKLLGWTPKHNLDSIISSALKWHIENPTGYSK